MSSSSLPSRRLSREELEAESAAALPAKEVLSVPLLDLNVDVDLALALAAPIDLAVAANANAALPIDAAVSANVLSAASTSTALAQQGVMIDQLISGEAIAVGNQDSMIDQTDTSGAGADTGTDGTGADGGTTGTDGTSTDPTVTTDPVQDTVDGVLDAGLLHVDANVHLDADLASPVAGAVAANANVAAPIDAAVSANIASIGSDSVAVADQTAIISQQMPDVTASATATQTAEVDQADTAGALDSGGTADTSGQ